MNDKHRTMTEKTFPNEIPLTAADDDNCYELVNDALDQTPGVVGVRLNPADNQFEVHYDAAMVSPQQARQFADQIAPVLQQRFATCNWQLNRSTSRLCESCALSLEQRLRQLDGVRRVNASFASGMLTITFDQAVTTPATLVEQVSHLGVGLKTEEPAAPTGLWPRFQQWFDANSDRLEILMTVLTFIGMVGGLIAEWLGATGISTAFYVLAYAAGSVFGLQAGLGSLLNLTIDVDLLMILAAAGAALVGAPFEGAMLLFLFSLSNVLQNLALDRTRNAIRALMKLRPNEAMVRRASQTVVVPVEQIRLGEVMVIRPGERLALDGVVVEGSSAIDQAPITGESMPVQKTVGDLVLAGTINQTGGLEVRVTKRAADTTLARLIKLVESAQSEKAQTQRWIDRFEQIYAVTVVVITLITLGVGLGLLGETFDVAFYRAMTVMVGASPCALVISTPATILSAIGNGARRGVLFKGGVHMEQAATIKVVAFDKTGTLTQGKPIVTDVVPLNGLDRDSLLTIAAAVEAKSEHPLAQAVVNAARQHQLALPDATAFKSVLGAGVFASINDERIFVGNLRHLESYALAALDTAQQASQALQRDGKTAIVVARIWPNRADLLGVLGIADTLRDNAAATVRKLKALGVERVVMLTGDHTDVAQAIGLQAGVDEVYAELLPEDKLTIVRKLRETYGAIAMVGDGVNDAPALAAATLGVAMGAAGTDVALETADVVLMADDLDNIPYFIDLGRAARRTLIVNIGFALVVIVVLIVGALGIGLPLPLSVIGHEGSTILVSLNGLRLLGYKGSALLNNA